MSAAGGSQPAETGPDQLAQAASKHVEWQTGWRALTASTTGVGVGYGLFLLTAGLFIVPLQNEMGVPRSAVALSSFVGIATALLAPAAGIVIDRFGSRVPALAGLSVLALGYLILALSPAELGWIYGALIVVAVAAPFTSAVIFCRNVATWFSRSTGLAMGITMSGVSIIGAFALPGLATIIASYGWRAGFASLAGLSFLLGLPMAVAWLREGPAVRPFPATLEPQYPRQRVNQLAALKASTQDRRFWLMLASFGIASVPIGAFMSQLQPILGSAGFDPTQAAAIGSLFAASIGLGRIISGGLLDRFSPNTVACACLALSALGAACVAEMSGGSLAPTWLAVCLAVCLLGAGQGAEAEFYAFFIIRIFGLATFATIFGIVAFVVGVGMAGGGLLFAHLYDINESYRVAAHMAGCLYICAGVLIRLIRFPATGN